MPLEPAETDCLFYQGFPWWIVILANTCFFFLLFILLLVLILLQWLEQLAVSRFLFLFPDCNEDLSNTVFKMLKYILDIFSLPLIQILFYF